MPPQQPRKLELTPEDLEKVARARERHEGVKVDENWLFIAEFGYYYGWEGVMAILNNQITYDEAAVLLQGAIKVWYGKLVQQTETSYLAVRAARAKTGRKVLNRGLSKLKKLMGPD